MQVTHIIKSNANKISHPEPNISESVPNATKTIVMMHKPANRKRLPIPRFVTFFSTLFKFISAILIFLFTNPACPTVLTTSLTVFTILASVAIFTAQAGSLGG